MYFVLLIVQLVAFIGLATAFFTLPGIYFLEKSTDKLNFWEKIILGSVVGLVFFSLVSYLFSVIKLHFLLLPLILIFSFLEIKKLPNLFKKYTRPSGKRLSLILLVFIIGITGQLLIIAPSGINLNGDLVFWSSHGHDGLWHISLMQEYQKGYPLQNPVFAGTRLVNYHFFSDIAPSDFNLFFKFSLFDLYFRFFPLLFSILLGGLAYLLGKKLGGNFQTGLWATVFTYFAGSFGYILTYLKDRSIGGESIFWASQVQSSIGNPPQAAAFIIVLAFLYLFSFFIEKQTKYLFFVCTILAGTLAVFKVYGAVVILASLGLVGLWQLIRERKFNILSLFFSSSILSAILYLPNSQDSGAFLIFQPWWYVRTMVVTPDRLNQLDMELRRQTYIADHNWKRVIQLETEAFLIFFFGNLGMRFLALFSLPRLIKKSFSNHLNLIIILIILISFILPMLFLQKGVASNSIQFLQYYLLLMGIISAVFVSEISKKIKYRFINFLLGFLIILLAVPTQISLINSFYSRPPFAKVDQKELVALNFLKQNSDDNSVVLTPPYNQYLNLPSIVPQIWDWSDTGYVTALSNRRTYLADTEQVDIMGYDLKPRLNTQQELFLETEPKTFESRIKALNVSYLYFPKAQKPLVDLTKTDLKPIFSNDLVEIWQVK